MKKFLIQAGWTHITSIDPKHKVITIPNIVADVEADSRALAELIVRKTWGDDPDVSLCEVVEEIDASDLGGFLGELANRIDIKKLN